MNFKRMLLILIIIASLVGGGFWAYGKYFKDGTSAKDKAFGVLNTFVTSDDNTKLSDNLTLCNQLYISRTGTTAVKLDVARGYLDDVVYQYLDDALSQMAVADLSRQASERIMGAVEQCGTARTEMLASLNRFRINILDSATGLAGVYDREFEKVSDYVRSVAGLVITLNDEISDVYMSDICAGNMMKNMVMTALVQTFTLSNYQINTARRAELDAMLADFHFDGNVVILSEKVVLDGGLNSEIVKNFVKNCKLCDKNVFVANYTYLKSNVKSTLDINASDSEIVMYYLAKILGVA